MVAIFTGAGAGFTRGSANLLGSAAQLGSGRLGRGGEEVAVNAATGNIVVAQQDEFLVGRGPDVGISRTYNSRAEAGDGDNGDNWQQSTTRRVFGLTGTVSTAGSTVIRQAGDGSVIGYSWDDAAGAYVSTDGSGAFDTLAYAAGSWTWTDGDSRVTETYEAHGTDNWRIVAVSDTDGNSLTYSYTGDKLDKVTTADGSWTQYVWSGDNITQIVTGYTDLATSTSQTLTRTRYSYDGSNRLASVTTDLSPHDSTISDGDTYTVSYTYDGGSNRIASISQTDGSLLTVTYDTVGRVASLTQSVATGEARVTSLTYSAGYTEVTGPDGEVTRLDYDGAGQLTGITAPPTHSGATPQQVQFAYDAQGNLTGVTDGGGNVTTYDHDTNGNVTHVTDANGNVIERTYDAENHLITELAYGSNESGPNAAHYAQYAYDAEGHLRYAVDGAGQVTEYEYTATGEVARRIEFPEHPYPVGAAAIDEAGMDAWVAGLGDLRSTKVVDYTYDTRGNQTSTSAYEQVDASGTNPSSVGVHQTTFQVYDQAGRLLSRHRDGELAESFLYDGLGRLVVSTDVNGGTTTVVFDDAVLTTTVTTASGLVTVSVYNRAGELVSRTDSGASTVGGTAAYQYDRNGRLRIVADATGRESYIVYDQAGRKVADVNHLGEIVAYRYDQADRVVATIRYAAALDAAQLALLADPDTNAELSALLPAASGADQWHWTVYDDGGRVIQEIGADSSVAAFEYDASDRLIKTTSYLNVLTTMELDALKLAPPATPVQPVAEAADVISRQFYNAAGLLVGTLDGEGYLTERVYDAAGQKVEEIAYVAKTDSALWATGSFDALRTSADPDADGNIVSHFVYDGQGQLRVTFNALGGVTVYNHDSAGRLVATQQFVTEQVRTDFTYEAVKGSFSPDVFDRLRLDYTIYDASGRAAYNLNREGAVTAFTYDSSGRVVKTVQFADLYDASDVDAWAADPVHADNSANRVTRNWYSERSELLFTVDAEGYVRGFTYDAEGRKIGETAWPDRIAVSDTTTTAQVATLAAGAGSPIALSYSYDQAGRLLTSTDGEGIVTRHFYNALGQITDTYLADNVAVDTVRLHYEYDAAGRLTAEYQAYDAAEQAGSFYAYDGLGNRISATDANGNTTTYTHDELGRVLTATNALGGVTAYQYDGFGNVVKLTDPNGNETYNYYDNLNRLVATRDAEDYLTETDYNRFDEVIAVRKYNIPLSYPAEVGVKPAIDDSIPPEVAAAYDHAAQLQADADALAAQLANLDADLAAVLADPLPWLENYLDELNVELADLEAQRDAAQANGDWLLWIELGGQINSLEDDIGDVERAIQRYQNGNGLSNDGRNIIEAAFDHDTLEGEAQAAQEAADQALADAQALEVRFSQSLAETKFDYDNRGLLKWKIDAEGYFEHYTYNAFGQRLSLSRYADPVEDGVPPIIDDYTPPPEVVAAYDHAAQLQADADALAAQLADLDANLAAALADPLPYLQAHLDGLNAQLATLNAELADLQQQYDEANAYEKFFVIGPQIDALEDDIDALEDDIGDAEAEIQRVQNGQNLTDLGVGIVEAAFDSDALESQVQAAQAAADQALADAQALEAQYLGVQATTLFAYDNRGQLTRVTDAEGYFETFGYDAYGQRISHTAKSSTASVVSGGTTTYVYDKRGLLLSETLPIASHTSSGAVQAPTITNRYVYDARGNQLVMIEADGLTEERTTTYTYDQLNRLIETKGDQVSGLTVSPTNRAISSTSGRPTETIAYDPRGNVIKTVDAAGARTVFFYDELNRKVAEINALGTYTSYQYDANGNVTQVRVYDQTVNVPAAGGTAGQAPAVPGGSYRETLFAHDGLNRMLSSAITGAITGEAISSTWNASTAAITTSYEYDYLGNVVKRTDPNNETVWSYYDKLGRKVSQVDGERYRTDWAYDYEGNVLTETRYASKAAVPDNTSAPPAATANAANDRITEYTYDLNGNRLSEMRLNVKVHNGNGGYSTVNSTISYLYNGLGQVIRKTEATGDQTNYAYDAGGRVTREVKSRSAVDYRYDGLGNLVRSVQAAVNGSAARVTTYSYGAGGRLAGMTDAAGQVHSYFYDVAGRLVLESYVRSKAAGSSVTEGIGYRYDVLGRNRGQAYYLKSGSNWLFQSANDYSTLQYNAHGEVTRIAINGVYRQQNKYDAAGRIWATNSGDGIWKYFGYDKNGNQTLVIASAGYDLTGLSSISNAYSLASRNDVNATITKYDGHNQAISVVEEGRELGGSTVQLTTSRNYNAFGEVISETDAGSATINYVYNTMGRLITVRSPQISITTEAGTNQNVRPTENFYYDTSGRLTGQRDANGNLTKYTLLAGSGYGGSQALVTRETHADGGIIATVYNAHGDATKVTDEVGLVTNMSYDNLGRLTQVNNPGGLVDHYAYDVLGRRIWHYNSLLGSGNKETTDYDIQGRIISQRAFGGDTTSTTYVRSSAIATPGMGTFGGWTETTTYANGKTLVEKKDLFGRTTQRTDLGGNVTNFTYDKAGRLVEASSGAANNVYTYFNTGRIESAAATTSYQYYIPLDPYYGGGYVYASTSTSTANYTYDKVGNRLTELGTTSTTVNGSSTTETWKNQTGTYDALGRLKTWHEAGTGTSPAADITYYYDAAGNVRRSTATYRQLGADGTVSSTTSTQDFWFRYDSMNRLVVDRGILSDGVITRDFEDADSKEILYDQAGRRVAVLNYRHTPGIYVPEYNIVIPGSYQEQREIYQYDSAGRLSQVDLSSGTAVEESYDSATGTYSPAEPVPSAPASGTRRASFTYDAMGRLTLQREYEADGTTVAHDRAVSYNAKNQISSDITNTKRGSDVYKATSTYNYGSGTSYALGSVVSVTTSNLKNGSYQAGTSTSYIYTWRDGAVQSQISFDGNTGSSSNPLYTTSLSYDAAGRLTSAYISDGKPRSVTYRIDENGQIIRRDESRPSNVPTGQTGSPHEVWYRFGGRELGYVGNNGTSDVSYPASITERQTIQSANPGTFRNGSTYGTSYADFAQSYDPINSYAQGAAGGSYTVQTGDTLQSIAQTIWGDSNLWYKLAEANGLSGNAGLIEGQVLMLPAGVVRTAHNAGTVKPYDPNAAIGDLSPTTPAPPKTKNKGCGGFGAILLSVVAVAVTAIVAPQFIGVAAKITGATTATVVGGGLAGAAGSVASQAVGLATGIQDKFSWKGVALAAIGGGIGGAVSANGVFGEAGLFGGVRSGVAQAGLRGTASSLAGQGIGVATGLQSKFDFAGVAAAGVGSAVGMAGARRLGVKSFNAPGGLSAGNIAGHALAGTAGAIANAATRSAINGNSFGDNLTRALPDVIGSTVGNALADGLTRSPKMAYEDVRTGDEVMGVGTTGASDDPQAHLMAGITGSDAQFGDIVVTADPHMRDLFKDMTDYQWSWYFGRAGQHSDHGMAHMALGLARPAMAMATSSFGRVSSYDSPLVQSLKVAAPFGLYDDAPAQQYMLGDGTVFTGTSAALNRFKQQRAAQADMVYMERITGSTFSGIALGVANSMGASPAAQDLAYGLGSSADGFLIARGAMAGARVPGIGNQPNLSIVNGENGIHANSRLSGRTTYLYELQTSDGQLLKYGVSINPATRYSNSFMVGKRIIPITSGTRSDMLTLERQMVTANPGPLNMEPWAVKARGGN